MSQHDWSRFQLRIPVKADIHTIFRSWTTPNGLTSWFLREADFIDSKGSERTGNSLIEKDDTYVWRWHGWSDDTRETGVVLEVNENDSFEFTFGDAGIVNIKLTEESGDNIVELTQYNIPTDPGSRINYYLGCSKGWLFYLANLKSILEGGLDLRNRKVELTNVVNS